MRSPEFVKLKITNAVPKPHYITKEEYREGEEISTVKHEWLNGVVYAMAGGTFNHSTICNSISTAATNALKGKSCKARNSEQRIKIQSNGQEVYPDAVIFCLPSRFVGKGDSTLLTPKIVFEVLSDSTQKYHRTSKFALYKTIETLEEYILIEQDRIWIDHFWKAGDNWLQGRRQLATSLLQRAHRHIETAKRRD